MSEISPEDQARELSPDGMWFVNDPNTGHQDAILELWHMGEHDGVVSGAVNALLKANGDSLSAAVRGESLSLGGERLSFFLTVGSYVLKNSPKLAQFVVVGKANACAIYVSYENPMETPPRTHPQIHAALSEEIGADYIAFKKRQFRSRRKG